MARARGDFPIPAVVLSKGELPSPFMRSLVLKTPIIDTKQVKPRLGTRTI